ncbi:MAG: HAD family phosphatase [Clostridia bacterium]|nr:HAD family phosphatase [Clostridia bacterium]
MMKKFEGILLCTDLDGTLFNSHRQLSKENREAIEYFKNQGGSFTIITGRVPATSKEICRLVKPNVPYGTGNGGGIYDFEAQKFLWTATLTPDFLELVEWVDRNFPDMGIQLNTAQGVYFNKDNPALEDFRRITGLSNRACHYREVPGPVMKVVFAHRDGARIEALMEGLAHHPKAGQFDFIRSEHTLYELLPKGVSKGNALLKMAELLGIDPAKTVAVGDYDNDISMIRAAGVGYAVANALPQVKEVADRITVSNDRHAIAKIIEELDRLEDQQE